MCHSQDANGDTEMADGEGEGGDEENAKKRKVIYVLSFCFFSSTCDIVCIPESSTQVL